MVLLQEDDVEDNDEDVDSSVAVVVDCDVVEVPLLGPRFRGRTRCVSYDAHMLECPGEGVNLCDFLQESQVAALSRFVVLQGKENRIPVPVPPPFSKKNTQWGKMAGTNEFAFFRC